MSDSPAGLSPRAVIGVQYFVYFGVLGAFLPYFNLYCYHLGFTGFQIGLLSALRSLTLTIFPVAWGLLADRYRVRRQMYISCTIASTLVWVLFLRTTDFPTLFFITLLYGVFYAPIISFLETFAVESLGRDRGGYGRVRAWGSISFIVTVVAMGRVIDARSVDVILVAILGGSALLSACAVGMPPIRETAKGRTGVRLTDLLNRQTLVFLASAFLMLVSHGAYYGFFSIHLEALGYDKTFVGVAWALASVAEVLVMVRSRSMFNRFSYKTVLAFSFGVAALRWFVLFATVSPAGILALPAAARRDLRGISHGQHPLHGPVGAGRRQNPGPGAQQCRHLRARAHDRLFHQRVDVRDHGVRGPVRRERAHRTGRRRCLQWHPEPHFTMLPADPAARTTPFSGTPC